jgi:hypothetical protein
MNTFHFSLIEDIRHNIMLTTSSKFNICFKPTISALFLYLTLQFLSDPLFSLYFWLLNDAIACGH